MMMMMMTKLPAPDRAGLSNVKGHPQKLQTVRVTPCQEGMD